MKLGFCLFKYFPYGGLQRDFMDVAQRCLAAGHEIYVYTLAWQGEMPAAFKVRIIESKAWSNHRKYEKYHQQMLRLRSQDQLDCVIGFNKMPGLDVYFASDPSYKVKPHNLIQRLGARYRHFIQYEEAVCGPVSQTHILTIAPAQQQEYQRAWDMEDSRFTLLPPGISREALPDSQAASHRARIRAEFGVKEDEFLLLMIGSGFRTKGLDRALLALKALPEPLRDKTRLGVIGQDKPDYFEKMAAGMGLANQVKILPGRADIAAVMQAGDCLIHPAYREVAGKVILEAVVGGLPVLVSDVCGYAHHVEQAEAGYVLPSPFDQQQLNTGLLELLNNADLRQHWHNNGIAYGQTEDLYQMAEVAAQFIQQNCREKMEAL